MAPVADAANKLRSQFAELGAKDGQENPEQGRCARAG